jgi:hypothetical protein
MKQKSLEETAENAFNDFQSKNPIVPQKHIRPFKLGFANGAKWQAERMYNEEDMKLFAEWLIKINFNYTSNISDIFLVWKKQFKKNR